MTSQIIPVEPFDFIIFGGTGDLAERKLLPSLYYRQRGQQFSEPTRIIGASRAKLTDEDYRGLRPQGDHRARQAAEIDRPGRAEHFLGAAVLRPCRCHERRGLRQAEKGDRRQRPHPRLLPGGRAGALRRYLAQARQSTSWSTPQTRASWWRSRSAATLPSAQALNDAVGDDLQRTARSSASIITSARRRCRT